MAETVCGAAKVALTAPIAAAATGAAAYVQALTVNQIVQPNCSNCVVGLHESRHGRSICICEGKRLCG